MTVGASFRTLTVAWTVAGRSVSCAQCVVRLVAQYGWCVVMDENCARAPQQARSQGSPPPTILPPKKSRCSTRSHFRGMLIIRAHRHEMMGP